MHLFYFGLFFGVVLALSFFRLFVLDAPVFFWVHAVLEALIETTVFLTIACVLERQRKLFWAMIGCSFFVLLLHLVDFMVWKIMDGGLGYVFNYLFSSGFRHVFVAFQALNLHLGFWALIVGAVMGLPMLGILLYRACGLVGKTTISLKQSASCVAATTILLVCFNFAARPSPFHIIHEKHQKSLPLSLSFFTPSPPFVPFSLPHPPSESTIQQQLHQLSFPSSHRPNIYLFIIESLRKDFVTPQTAPNLSTFAQNHISCTESFANANTTHESWFSIFHGRYPHERTALQRKWTEGSVPLQVLKKLGYQINVYSSADLGLFEVDGVLFGKGRKLLNSVEEYNQQLLLSPADRDALGFEALARDVEKTKSGTVFVVFIDATHSEYSVPQGFVPKFTPVVDHIDYLSVNRDNIEPVKNRYRNAIFYVDSLFGQFFAGLKKQDLYDEAVIAITADHGEEFFEEGALFHGTHLNRYQTSVPLFLKLGEQRKVVPLATHVDLMPSVLHCVTGVSAWNGLIAGKSVLLEGNQSFRLCILHNGAHTPSEFLIEDGGKQMHLRCPKGQSIYESNAWELLR